MYIGKSNSRRDDDHDHTSPWIVEADQTRSKKAECATLLDYLQQSTRD